MENQREKEMAAGVLYRDRDETMETTQELLCSSFFGLVMVFWYRIMLWYPKMNYIGGSGYPIISEIHSVIPR